MTSAILQQPVTTSPLDTAQGRYNLECIYNFIDGFCSVLASNTTRSAYVFDTSPDESALLMLFPNFTGEIELPGGELLLFAVDSLHLNSRVVGVLNAAQNI